METAASASPYTALLEALDVVFRALSAPAIREGNYEPPIGKG